MFLSYAPAPAPLVAMTPIAWSSSCSQGRPPAQWACNQTIVASPVYYLVCKEAARPAHCAVFSAAPDLYRCGSLLIDADTFQAIADGSCHPACEFGLSSCSGALASTPAPAPAMQWGTAAPSALLAARLSQPERPTPPPPLSLPPATPVLQAPAPEYRGVPLAGHCKERVFRCSINNGIQYIEPDTFHAVTGQRANCSSMLGLVVCGSVALDPTIYAAAVAGACTEACCSGNGVAECRAPTPAPLPARWPATFPSSMPAEGPACPHPPQFPCSVEEYVCSAEGAGFRLSPGQYHAAATLSCTPDLDPSLCVVGNYIITATMWSAVRTHECSPTCLEGGHFAQCAAPSNNAPNALITMSARVSPGFMGTAGSSLAGPHFPWYRARNSPALAPGPNEWYAAIAWAQPGAHGTALAASGAGLAASPMAPAAPFFLSFGEFAACGAACGGGSADRPLTCQSRLLRLPVPLSSCEPTLHDFASLSQACNTARRAAAKTACCNSNWRQMPTHIDAGDEV